MAATILIVEDEFAVARGIQYALQQEGYTVAVARSGEEGLEFASNQAPDLVVLDVRLPGIDGFEVLRRLRASGSKAPVLMLTARDEEVDKVAGLELGADDYVPKPFSPRELTARIKAVLRRAEDRLEREVLTLGEITLRRDTHEVTVDGRHVPLSPKEFDLLAYLMEHPGIVFSRDQLLDRVWQLTYAAGTRTVDAHIAQVRSKLGRPELIKTVHGAGYKAVRP